MARRAAAPVMAALVLGLGSCTSASTPRLPAGSAPTETGSAAEPSRPVAGAEPVGTTIMAKQSPTEIYELVASGALGCWFGAGGPLKASHVFHAEAKPPADGGAAEIVLHERDATFSDQRGPRAFRVALTKAPGGAQVSVANLKMAPAVAEAMIKDVETWAAGEKGCEVRRLYPPPPPVPDKDRPRASGKTPAKAARQP